MSPLRSFDWPGRIGLLGTKKSNPESAPPGDWARTVQLGVPEWLPVFVTTQAMFISWLSIGVADVTVTLYVVPLDVVLPFGRASASITTAMMTIQTTTLPRGVRRFDLLSHSGCHCLTFNEATCVNTVSPSLTYLVGDPSSESALADVAV